MSYETKNKHISTIVAGDVIKHQGRIMTVSKNDIKTGFMGITIFGDSYKLGHKPVKFIILS